MDSLFVFRKRIELFHIDAAGIVFHGDVFEFVHEAFANFLREKSVSIKERIDRRDFLFPVVHTSANYLKPMMLDDVLDVHVQSIDLKDKSFSVQFELYVEGAQVCNVKIIHACIEAQNFKPIKIPDEFKKIV